MTGTQLFTGTEPSLRLEFQRDRNVGPFSGSIYFLDWGREQVRDQKLSRTVTWTIFKILERDKNKNTDDHLMKSMQYHKAD